MKPLITKKEFDELMAIEGKVRGVSFKTEEAFIIKKEGKEGPRKIEDAITNLGYSFNFEDIKGLEFYPLGLEVANLILIKRIFGWDDGDFQEMGRFESKISLIIKLFMRYFVSIEKALSLASKMWSKYYSIGNIKATEINKEKRYIVLKLDNFSIHPLYCQNFKGYFSSLARMIIGERVVCEETKCPFKGDEYHEFLLRW